MLELSGIPMFHWPPHTQTAPTRTALRVTFFGPEILTMYGPPAGGTAITASHFPSAAAFAWADFPSISTITVWPGSVQPQKRLGFSRCRTMWSAKIGLRKGSAGLDSD